MVATQSKKGQRPATVNDLVKEVQALTEQAGEVDAKLQAKRLELQEALEKQVSQQVQLANALGVTLTTPEPEAPRERQHRKQRAKRSVVLEFLAFVKKTHPTYHQLTVKQKELDLSDATVYKYVDVEQASGKHFLKEEGLAALKA